MTVRRARSRRRFLERCYAPGDLDVGLVGGDREAVVADLLGHAGLGTRVERGQLVLETGTVGADEGREHDHCPAVGVGPDLAAVAPRLTEGLVCHAAHQRDGARGRSRFASGTVEDR